LIFTLSHVSLIGRHIVVRLPSLADHATPKLQSHVATFTSRFIYQFNTFFDRV
jgi:hypothetical protein